MAEQKPPKRTEKIQAMLDDGELAAIDNRRFDNRLPSRTVTIRELIRRGLIAGDQLPAPPPDRPSGEFRSETDQDSG